MFGFTKYIGQEYTVKNLHRFYGFPEPTNEHMTSIIDMYHNAFISLSWILIVRAKRQFKKSLQVIKIEF